MSDVTVVSEPRTYEENSPYSFFGDVVRSLSPSWAGHGEAKARLARHAVELEGEIRSNRCSPEARRVLREQRNRDRDQIETRGATSSTISGFTTPQYLIQHYRAWRENPPTFMWQLNMQDIGEYGLQMNVPTFTAGGGIASQTEGSALTESDPTSTYVSTNLTTYAGKVTVSQQLLDRAGPGQTFDKTVYAQVRQEYEQQVDAAVITAAIASAQTISNSGTFGIAGLYGDIYNARQKLETAAGTKLRPTHVFFLPDPWAFAASQVGTDGRPIMMPAPVKADYVAMQKPPVAIMGDNEDILPAGYTGYAFGDIPAFTDNSIPLTSGNATIIVMNSSAIIPFVQQDPTVAVYPETLANNLQALVMVWGYATANVVHASGICAISGAAYSATPTFAG